MHFTNTFTVILAHIVHTSFVVMSHPASDPHGVQLTQAETNVLTVYERVDRDVSGECIEPTQEELLQLLENTNAMNRHVESENEEIMRSKLLATLSRISESTPSCTEEDLQSSSHLLSETLNLRTSCPWEVITNVNNTRYPREIPYTVCKCTNCVSLSGSSYFSTSYCQPVIVMVPVLVKGECVNNVARYTLHEEPVSVGCVCERPSDD